jgi:hypothetical protein
MTDQEAFEHAITLYTAHCEKTGETFTQPDAGEEFTIGGETVWVLTLDEKLISMVWEDGIVTTETTAQVVELEEQFKL